MNSCPAQIKEFASFQFELISLQRLFEYTNLLQEKPSVLPTDDGFRSVVAAIKRKVLGELEVVRADDGTGAIQVLRKVYGKRKPLLQQTDDGTALVLAQGVTYADLDPK